MIGNYTELNKHLSGVYMIVNTVSGKRYVGSTCRKFLQRHKEHVYELSKNEHPCIHLQRAWNKYGQDRFIFNIIEILDANNPALILEREQIWLDDAIKTKSHYNTLPTAGSSANRIVSKETRLKISLAGIGRPQSKETRAKRGASLLGHTISEEARRKSSRTQKGRKFSETHLANLRKAHKESTNRKHTDARKKASSERMKLFWKENREKQIASMQKEMADPEKYKARIEKIRIASTGRKHTEESKRKMRKPKNGLRANR